MENYKFRRKPQYIMVNGFKVPKPLDSNRNHECVWAPDFERDGMAFCYRSPLSMDRLIGIHCAHATREAAIAHAKAMLGIDPEYFK